MKSSFKSKSSSCILWKSTLYRKTPVTTEKKRKNKNKREKSISEILCILADSGGIEIQDNRTKSAKTNSLKSTKSTISQSKWLRYIIFYTIICDMRKMRDICEHAWFQSQNILCFRLKNWIVRKPKHRTHWLNKE